MMLNILFPFTLLISALVQTQAQNVPVQAPPILEHAFSAAIHLGPAIRPIPIAGGFRGAVAILPNSTISGRINGTVTGGIAYSAVYMVDNSTYEVPAINLYGISDDGYPFVVGESGIGNHNGLFTRVSFDMAGPYRELTQSFILASLVEIGRTVWIEAYIVRTGQTENALK